MFELAIITMKKSLYALSVAGLLSACATTQYHIEGSTSLTNLDGKKIYVKTIKGDDMQKLDSCEIIHGKFAMKGDLDSVCMGVLFLDDQSLMPLVLEPASMTVNMNDTAWRVTGTSMNDELYQFITAKTKLEAEVQELPRKENRMILDGKDEYIIHETLNTELLRIQKDYDRLVMDYVTRNFDNMLSVGVFMIHTIGQPPLKTPQIEDIMSKASERFKNDAYIRWYMEAAESNERAMNR